MKSQIQAKEENTKLLVKNTLLLYGRMLFSLVVSLYSSRLILQALGESDYGVYNVVGGVVGAFSVVTGALTGAISRFFTFELGKGNQIRLEKTFSTAFIILCGLAVIVIVLVETVGVWFLNNKMTIPPERVVAANWTLQCSLGIFIADMMATICNATMLAHENFNVYAYVAVIEVLGKLGIALFLAFSAFSGDKLILYSVLLLIIQITIQIYITVYCKAKYSEFKIKLQYDKSIFKEVFGFASWNFFSSMVGMLNGHGVNILLNMSYGPVVNAARGLSMTVNNIIANFVNNFITALKPQVIKTYASGDLDYTKFIIYRGTKFSFFIMLLLGLPVLLEADTFISLWLVEVPEHTVNFVRLVLIISFIDVLSVILGLVQNATGIIRNYSLIMSAVQSLNFVFAYILLRRTSLNPEYIYVVSIFVSLIILIVRLLFARKYVGASFKVYCRDVLMRLAAVSSCASALPVAMHYSMDESIVRFISVCATCIITSALSIYFIGCNRGERTFILGSIESFLSKFGIRFNPQRM